MNGQVQVVLIVAAVCVALGAAVWLWHRRSRPVHRAVSEGTAQEILATMADGLLVCGRTGRIENVNEALCSLTGMTRKVLLGTPMVTLFSGEGDETFVGTRWQERKVDEELARLHTADGEAIDVSVSISQLREGEELRGAVVLVRDIRESRAAEERLRALGKAFETTQVGITIADIDGTILYVNPADAALHGYEAEELIGGNVSLLAPPELRNPLRADELRALRQRRRETTNLRKDGSRFPVELTSDLLTDAEGRPVGVVTSCLDITERKRTEARFQSLLESTPDPMVIVDREGRITLVNTRLEQALGYAPEELLGQPVEVLLPERYRDAHPGFRAQYLADPVARPMGAERELTCRRKDGSEIPVDVSLSPSREGEELSVIAAIRDVSERKRLEEELRRRAFYDDLTHLPNRSLLMDRLRQTISRAEKEDYESYALLSVGLDRLDAVTTSLGPEAGDELLRLYADRLKAFALAGDTVARIGGEVFAILVDRLTGLADATRLADRILDDLGRRFQVAGQEVFAGASIGVVLPRGGPQRGEDILRDAETAMRRSRHRRGPNSYEVFNDAMHERAVLRLELETELQRALERQELILEYQPIVSTSGGHIRGAEALVRWRHPRRGMIPPSTLLPLAEDTGLIMPIGEWVLKAACLQNLIWQQAGFDPIFVAVNLSATQFRQRELPALVRGVLRESGLDPRRLELELTETVLMEDSGHALNALGALAETGVGLCVDDFGVGHSSLSYLQRFPMQTLKIDQSFVRDLGQGTQRAESMIASIIGLAHNLGLKAIAEGVESEQQRAVLESQACDECQGYYFSRPLSGESFSELLAAV